MYNFWPNENATFFDEVILQTPGFISSEAKDRLQGYTYALGVRITKTGIRSVNIFRDTRPENLNQFLLNIRRNSL